MKENRKVIRFLITSLGLCLSWFILYDIWLSSFDKMLTLHLADVSVGLLNLLGYNAASNNSNVFIDGSLLVHIGPSCNGMVLMALFSGFIIAFPGPVLKKLFYIPFGIFIINVINVIRMAALALNVYYSHQTFDFNHKYTFTIVVYAFIFGLWMLWVKKFSFINNYAPTTLLKEQAA